MTRWTMEQVLAAAPDEKVVKAARALAKPGPWSEAGATEALVWGRCQGSGSTPYQVTVDTSAPAYRCSCPSRKFPCKHALALLMRWAAGEDLSAEAPPEFAAEWAAGRQERQVRREAKAKAPVDPAQAAQRVEARLATMDAGIEELATWLQDVARSGTAALRAQVGREAEAMGARLVDAQCPALGAEVRGLPASQLGDAQWQERTLELLGRWWTVVQAWRRRESLPPERLADLRAVLGWSWSTEEVAAGERVTDCWAVLGVRRTDDGRLAEQRTWLRGLGTGTTALVLDFAVGTPLPLPHLTGSVLAGEVALYPGTAPRRALLLGDPAPLDDAALEKAGLGGAPPPGAVDVGGAMASVAGALAANPLTEAAPLLLAGVRLTASHLVDAHGRALPVLGHTPWELLAASEGRPVTCFAEWTPRGVIPLALYEEVLRG